MGDVMRLAVALSSIGAVASIPTEQVTKAIHPSLDQVPMALRPTVDQYVTPQDEVEIARVHPEAAWNAAVRTQAKDGAPVVPDEVKPTFDSHRGPERCAYTTLPLDAVLPEADPSTTPYMDFAKTGTLDDFGIDLEGLWWMRGNPLPEVFVSFTGMVPDENTTAGSFPATYYWYSSLKGRWAWPYGSFLKGNYLKDVALGFDKESLYYLPGWGLMAYYALTSYGGVPMKMLWVNASYAALVPVADVFKEGGGATRDFVFRKNVADADGDTWFREDVLPGAPPELIYTLTRVVRPDGTKTKYWDDLLQFAKKKKFDELIVWGSDDDCRRACELVLSCNVCVSVCGIRDAWNGIFG